MKVFKSVVLKYIYKLILIVILFILIDKIINRVINRFFSTIKKKKADSNKINTLQSLVKSIIKYLLLTIEVLLILKLFGIDTTALIASLGVVSLVVGLAFQDMLKDILAGFSIIFENQYKIGDYVKINGFYGKVIYIGLKTTKIKSYFGEIKIISNRNVSEVTNYSYNDIYAYIDIAAAYEEKISNVEKILNLEKENVLKNSNNLFSDYKLLGVEKLSDSSVVFRIIAKCNVENKEEVERILNKEIKNVFDKHKIKIPYPQLEVHHEK